MKLSAANATADTLLEFVRNMLDHPAGANEAAPDKGMIHSIGT